MPRFIHHDLRLLNPAFSSSLLDVLTDLEQLRRAQIIGTTPYPVFLQLKGVFHMLESFASARIEGNHTTLAEYVETKVATLARTGEPLSDTIREIENIETAMRHVEVEVRPSAAISEHLIRGLHATTVKNLEREGDRSPGAYRLDKVAIGQAEHAPPEFIQVPSYMQELVEFINRSDPPKYDLIKVALAHHRFAWIHPFFNGNGRVVRLLTYALLIKYGFRVDRYQRLLNPTAVFCADRTRYYAMLANADSGTDDALETWCHYVLAGVRDELSKVDRLTDYKFLKSQILAPALAHARERRLITPEEEAILRVVIEQGVAKAGHFHSAMHGRTDAQRTYQVKKLLASGLLQPIKEGARQYSIGFTQSPLLRGVMMALTTEGFIPPALNAPATPAVVPASP